MVKATSKHVKSLLNSWDFLHATHRRWFWKTRAKNQIQWQGKVLIISYFTEISSAFKPKRVGYHFNISMIYVYLRFEYGWWPDRTSLIWEEPTEISHIYIKIHRRFPTHLQQTLYFQQRLQCSNYATLCNRRNFTYWNNHLILNINQSSDRRQSFTRSHLETW